MLHNLYQTCKILLPKLVHKLHKHDVNIYLINYYQVNISNNRFIFCLDFFTNSRLRKVKKRISILKKNVTNIHINAYHYKS